MGGAAGVGGWRDARGVWVWATDGSKKRLRALGEEG